MDITGTIAARSDQLNADDLIGGAITIQISKVSMLAGEQPVAIHYVGDEGKPWKPCKTARRVLVGVWGGDASKYAGRWLTLYRDADVIYAGQKVGGIRISHMSDIEKPVTLALTASNKSKKPITVQPLKVTHAKDTKDDAAKKAAADIIAKIREADDVNAVISAENHKIERLKAAYPALYSDIQAAITERLSVLSDDSDDEVAL